MLWQQSNADREFLYLDTKSAIIREMLLKLRLSVHLPIFFIVFFISFPHLSHSHFRVCDDSSTHLFLSVSFLPVSGCLMAVLLLQMFLPVFKSWMFVCIVGNMVLLWLQKAGDIGIPNQILWDTGTELFKAHKTRKNGIHICIHIHTHIHIYLYVCVCMCVIIYIYIYLNNLFLFPIVDDCISIIILSLSNRTTLKHTDTTKWKRMRECYVNVIPIIGWVVAI